MTRPRLAIVAVAALAVAMTATGCNLGTGSPAASRSPFVVGLGYIGSVQFAPFYLADRAGYYSAAGLDVTFQNKIDPDLVTLVANGTIDAGIADGTSVIPAVSQGIPVRYVATLYGTFPNIVFAKASSSIKTAADLKGKKIGTPGRYGSSWVMLQALLDSVGLTPADVQIVEYPDFGQGAALAQGAVDAATGFTNNEPVQAQLTGTDVVVLHVDQALALPGPGLITSVGALNANTAKPAQVRAFVAATLRAMREIAADPQKGLNASIAAVPELGKDRATQAAILAATIATWAGPVQVAHGYGAFDRAGWTASIAYMTKLGLVPNPVSIDNLIVDGYLPSPS